MAYAETKRNNVKFYGVSLSTSVSNINDTTARIYWTATVDFGNWYYYGVRLHVKVGGAPSPSAATPMPPAMPVITAFGLRLTPNPSRCAATEVAAQQLHAARASISRPIRMKRPMRLAT